MELAALKATELGQQVVNLEAARRHASDKLKRKREVQRLTQKAKANSTVTSGA